MNKNIQPKVHPVKYRCASCGAEYTIMSTIKQDNVSIDVCSNCHPFYIGKAVNQKAKGRAEKLSAKFDAGMKNINAKPKKAEVPAKAKSNQKTVIKSLDDLQ